MKELDPGHLYELDDLKAPGVSFLHFYKDPDLHEMGWDGPSSQEVLRANIARVKALDAELPWFGNGAIILLLRAAIFLFEIRALMRKAQKAGGIEKLKTRKDGHVY